jgi:small subunit ribosomal protein S2
MVDIIDNIKNEVEEIVEEASEALGIGEKAEKKTAKKPKKSKDIKKEAEAESVDEKVVESIEEKRKKLLEKAKKLGAKMDVATSEDLKEQVKAKKKGEMLIPLEDYVKSGIYLGTRVVTPKMKQFVYRRRADGLAIFNTDIIDEKLKESIEFLSKFDANQIVLVIKRPAGWKVAQMFSRLTGIRTFTKKYPAGILTNTQLPDFFENELTIVGDAWLDKNALSDTLKVNKKVLMICDTNNFPVGASQIVIGNNKSSKSLGVIFYILTRGYMKAKGLDTSQIPDMDWWMEEEVEVKREKEKKLRLGVKAGARYGV